MNLPDPKALKKLADTCRKAGIKHFRSADFEFTLSDEITTKVSQKSAKANSYEDQAAKFESDTLSPEELLFWSVSPPEESKESA